MWWSIDLTIFCWGIPVVRIYLFLVGLCLSASQAQAAPLGFPSWTYVMNTLAPEPSIPDDGTLFKVPGSEAAFTRDQTRGPFVASDWHPDDHPAMPKVVAIGRKPTVWACARCHRPNGSGGPENARIAGLPADYIVQQLKDMASGERSTVMPKRVPQVLKQSFVNELTEDEMHEAANYFSRLKPRHTLVVKESATAPKTVNRGQFFAASADGLQEELGDRIVEVPEDLQRFEVLHDDRVQFLVYVPPGSVAKGIALTRAPGGNSLACAGCHGADFRGIGLIPSIAGLSPTYVVRQLWDIKVGARTGVSAQAMKPVVASLSGQDMLALSAYLATLKP